MSEEMIKLLIFWAVLFTPIEAIIDGFKLFENENRIAGAIILISALVWVYVAYKSYGILF